MAGACAVAGRSQARVACSMGPRRGPKVPSATSNSLLRGAAAAAPRAVDQPAKAAMHPATLPLGAAGLAIVAADVFWPGSAHLLQPVDAATHAWVSAHLDLETQRFIAGKLVSDAAIVLGLAGWAGVTAVAVGTRNAPLSQALGASALVYWLAGGSIRHGDPPLVDALKHAFHRARPSDHHHTFAFPSGHTTAATYVCGALLFVLLPLALQALEEQQGRDAVRQAAAWLERRRAWVWGGAALLTATGRVMAEAHWCSDTLAGACLGAALTALTLQLTAALGGRAAADGRRP